MNDQKGTIPILILIAIVGVISVLAISGIAPFRDGVLNALFPKNSSQAATDEWTQDGHDAQRTGVTSEDPATPWTYQWSFNGPDSNGGTSNHSYDAPKEARIVTGGANIYVPAGNKGLYALKKTNGAVVWNITNTSFNATPAYDPTTQTVIAGGSDGQIYKINASTGSILGTFNTGSPINKSILLTGGFAYAISNNGNLNKINISNVSPVWTYVAGSTVATLPAYSASRDSIIYATDDLYVHAVNNSNGSQKWRIKPTPNSPGDPAISVTQTVAGTPVGTQFENGWPVIAEKHGIVFVRLQLPPTFMFENGFNLGIMPNTNAAVRTYLQSKTNQKNLFALNLDDGTEKFIPAVAYGSTEDIISTRPEGYGVMGSMPIVKVLSDGTEVAYMHFRNGIANPPDGRWDGHMGEMVLDSTTVPGLVPGDMRFVKMNNYNGYGGNSYTHIIDEQTPLSMAGNSLFNAHWGASTGVKILDRSSAKGLVYTDPITTSNLPPVVRALKTCSDFNLTTHYAANSCLLQYVTDGGRYFGNVGGYWGYWNVADPPGWKVDSGNTIGTSYSSGIQPRYTYVSDGQLIVEGNGGEILVFKHSGVVPSSAPSPSISPSPSASPLASVVASPSILPSPAKSGDLDGNGKVDIFDYNSLLTNFGKTGASLIGDIDKNGKVDIFDYNSLLTNFGR